MGFSNKSEHISIPFSKLHHIEETVLSSPFEEITSFLYCIERERVCKEKGGLTGEGFLFVQAGQFLLAVHLQNIKTPEQNSAPGVCFL